MEAQNVGTVTASGETISDIQDYLASFNKEIQDNSAQEVPNTSNGDEAVVVTTSQTTATTSGDDETDTTYYVAEGSQISTFQTFGQTQGHFVEGTFYPQYYSSQNQQEYTTLSTFTEGAATGERGATSDALLQAGVTLVSATSESETSAIPTTSGEGSVQQVAVTLSDAVAQGSLQQIVLAAASETQETVDGEATEISVTIPASLASQAGAEELLQAVEAEGGESQQPTYVAMQPTTGQAQTIRMVVQGSEQEIAAANASGATLVTSDGQEIQVSEDNTLQMVASLAEQASQNSTDANNQMILNTGNAFQTVTIVPSDTSPGEVSYVLIVSQPEEGKEEDQKSVNMDMSVYDFNEGEQHVPAPEGEETVTPKARIVKISPKKSQAVSQAHMCNYCNYTSPKRYLLSRHMKSHSEERPHKCSVCERGFKTLASLQNHVNTHTGTRPHQCKECDSAFTTSGELVRHVRYKHTHEKPHKCTECDYASVELSKLKRHMRCHTGERPYQCPHCTYASPDTYKLKRHLRIHTGEKPYECDVCHARFTQSNSLKAHKLIHSGNKPIFQCELCPTTCGRKTDLRIHVQKLHTSDKPLKCKRCGKSFPDRYTYKVHVKTHEGEKCFKCDLCTYASISQRHLESHMLIHTDQKPYQCDQCDQAFRQKQLLKRHKNLYHDPDYIPPVPKEKTHECPECGRAFRHKGNLIRHMAIHDPDATAQEKAAAMRLNRRDKHMGTNGEELTEDESEDEYEDDEQDLDGQEGITLQANQMTTSEGQQVVVLEVIQLQGPEGEQQAVAVVAGDGMDMGTSLQAALGEDPIQKPVKRGRGRPPSINRNQDMLPTVSIHEENEVKVTPVNAVVVKRGRGRPRRNPMQGSIQILDQVMEDKGNESDHDQSSIANDNDLSGGRSLRIRKRRYEDEDTLYTPVKRAARGGRVGNSIRGRPRVRVSDAVTNTSPEDEMDNLPDEEEIERREAEAVKRRLEQKQKDMDNCFGFKEEVDDDEEELVHHISVQNDSGTSTETAMQLLAAMQHDEGTMPQ